jgi:hypothetical protein
MNFLNIKKFLKNKYNFIICSYISLLIIIFIYLFVKYNFILVEQKRFYYKYYIIIFFSIIFWLAILYQKDSIKKILVRFSFFLLIIIYSLEVFLNFFDPEKYIEKYQQKKKIEKTNGNYDVRSPFEVYLDFKKQGVNSILFPHFSNLLREKFSIKIDNTKDIFPLGGVSNILTIVCNDSGNYMKFVSDRYGLINKDETWDKSQIDIVVFGSSYAAGNCVDPEKFENYSGQIHLTTKKEVLNLALGASGTLMSVARFKEFFPDNRGVKKVVWFISEGEVSHTISREFKNKILSNYIALKSGKINFKQDLTSYNDLINKKLIERFEVSLSQYILNNQINFNYFSYSQFIKIIKIKRIRDLLLTSKVNFYNNKNEDEIKPMFKLLFEDLLLFLKDRDVELVLVCGPPYEKFSSNHLKNDCDFIIDVANSKGIKTFNIYKEIFNNNGNPLSYFPFGMKGHYSATTYKKIINAMIAKGLFN